LIFAILDGLLNNHLSKTDKIFDIVINLLTGNIDNYLLWDFDCGSCTHVQSF